MNLDAFLVGVIVATSVIAAAFFLRFWQRSHDGLFLAFGAAFLIEGANRLRFLALTDPGEGAASIYLVRLLAFCLILAAVAWKNFAQPRR